MLHTCQLLKKKKKKNRRPTDKAINVHPPQREPPWDEPQNHRQMNQRTGNHNFLTTLILKAINKSIL